MASSISGNIGIDNIKTMEVGVEVYIKNLSLVKAHKNKK